MQENQTTFCLVLKLFLEKETIDNLARVVESATSASTS